MAPRTLRLALALAAAAVLDVARCSVPALRPAAVRVASAAGARAHARMITQSKNVANLAKKQDTVDAMRTKLDEAALIFTFRADGVQVNKLRQLRNNMPAKSTITLVKNRLMKRAVDGNAKWDHLDGLLEYSNYWAFVHEDDIKPSIEAVEKFLKDTGRAAKEHPLGDAKGVRGGVFDGQPLDMEGIVTVSKLPSKLELIQQIAVGINLVPTKLGRSINLVPTKLGRAIKLAKADEDAPAQE
jgi:large subunit ribosomal protein L10